MTDDSAPETPTQPAMTMDEVAEGVEATIHDSSLSAEEAHNSALVSLADLCAKGTSQYAQKHYEEAADYYARASELQAEVNGEMDPQNAEVLFLYGRSLFRCGQGKSDVLGGRAQGEKKKSDKKKAGKKDGEDRVAEEAVKIVANKAEAAQNGNAVKKEGEKLEAKKPLFQFTGDENFEDSDEEVCSPILDCLNEAEVFFQGFSLISTRWRKKKATRRRRMI
jgi:HAT1-interacting factor 1